jgi:hypothetical protein
VFDVGDTIGEYRIVSKLSEGGMAALFLGRRTNGGPNDPPVAIKVIHESLSSDWQFVRMFVDEALISVRIRHPNVVRVDELGEQDNTYFLAMEYVHGCSLSELLRAMGKQGRRMRPEIAVWIGSQVAAGLHAAHEMSGHDGQLLGVVHRDVSPQNVLLALDGRVKLLDFGIAKAAGRAERTEAGVIKGKIRYMSPEQAAGEELDRRVDVYALGVVLWEMLTMRRFIEGKSDLEIIRKVRNPTAVPPSFRAEGIDPHIDDAVMAALAPDVRRRPPTCLALQRLLESAVPSGTVGPQHVAELLRVFVADEIQEAAKALPADVAGPIVAEVRAPKALPGEDETRSARISKEERTRTLTTQVPRVSFDEMTGDTEREGDAARFVAAGHSKAGGSEEIETRAVGSARAAGSFPDAREMLEVELEGLEELDANDAHSSLPSFDEVEEDEHTVEASGHEIATFLQKIRDDAIAAGVEPPASTTALPPVVRAQPATPAAHDQLTPGPPDQFSLPPGPGSAPPGGSGATPAAPSAARWLARVLVITLVAFGLGAGFAVVWVRFLR